MTLEQALEKQRKEIISLRAENQRFQKQLSGLFPIEEKEALEKRIRSLEKTIESKDKRYDEMVQYHTERYSKLNDAFKDSLLESADLRAQVSSLSRENDVFRLRAEAAETEVLRLIGENKKLNRKLNTNFENSSLPSSAKPFRKKIPNSRKPTGRKPGGQPGHKAHNATRLTPTKEPIYLPVPDFILNNPDFYPTGKEIIKQQIGIRICVDVTDYVALEFRNRTTGSRFHAPFPNGLSNPVNYDASIKAFAFILNNYYNVPVQKTQQCISDITRGVINLSTGTICNLASDFSSLTEYERANIITSLLKSDVIYSDATVSNINSVRKAVILCTDKKQVLYQHMDHKGFDGLSKTPLKNYTGTIVHDHDVSYYSYGRHHQECLAHVLRYLVGAAENEPELTWHNQMHDLLQDMIHIRNKNPNGIPKDKVIILKEKYRDILSLAEMEYQKHPPSKAYMDGYNLQKRMHLFQESHLYFLTHPEVDPTNNISERGLRKFKRKQKQAVVLRSDSGAQYICDALTIIETSKMQNKNVYDTVEYVFSK